MLYLRNLFTLIIILQTRLNTMDKLYFEKLDKKIFIHFNSIDGCAFHRLILPYKEVEKQTDLFKITWGYSKQDLTIEERAKEIASNDILIFNRILPDGLLEAVRKANQNIKVIIDMDDAWRLNEQHMFYKMYKHNNISEKILYHLKNADYITCTTEYLANMIRPFNKNVVIFPNALIPEGQFEPLPTQSNRIRFGLIGGSTHMKDYELLSGIANQLPKEILDKVQFVLCGFDYSYYQRVNQDGQYELKLAEWRDNPWVQIESMLTDNYKTVTPQNKQILHQYNKYLETSLDDTYRRIWLKDIHTYATAYNDVDVLLAPLLANSFNACKSELKLIEASVMGKAAIVSDVVPYTICGINAIERGGNINTDGNCLMVNNTKGSLGWAKAITRLVKDKELRNMITANLGKLTLPNAKYNLTKVAKDRIEFLKHIH